MQIFLIEYQEIKNYLIFFKANGQHFYPFGQIKGLKKIGQLGFTLITN